MGDVGRKIEHKIFGIGTVIYQDASSISVMFENKDHDISFSYPSNDYTNYFDFIKIVPVQKGELIEFLIKYIFLYWFVWYFSKLHSWKWNWENHKSGNHKSSIR